MYRFFAVNVKCEMMGFAPYEGLHLVKNLKRVGERDCWFAFVHHLKSGDLFSVRQVFFQPNCPVLMPGSTTELKKLVEFLKENELKIRVNGHTSGNRRIHNNRNGISPDQRFKGSAKKLSRKRAERVAQYLIENGIDKKRVKTKGFAGYHPVIKHPKSNADRLKNMRVEIEIL
jgi:outer membrane protein OmpA-like peptidoglycan-associated protein